MKFFVYVNDTRVATFQHVIDAMAYATDRMTSMALGDELPERIIVAQRANKRAPARIVARIEM